MPPVNNYSIKEIAETINGVELNIPCPESLIKDILFDSRKLISAEKTLFFAISTNKNDGHKYIADLFKHGVRNFVISNEKIEIEKFPKANFLFINDTLKALQDLCGWHRQQYNIPVIGITGSNGKTILKEWLYQLMCPDKNIVRSPKSFNSQIGVPLSVWQLEPANDLAIFEAGISMPEEMQNLQQIIKPDIGIFTNIGTAHAENFMGRQAKIREKLKLFTETKTLVYCKDHHEIDDEIVATKAMKNIEKHTWGFDKGNDLCILNIQKLSNKTIISALYNNEEVEINIPFSDNASVENAIHCWLTMLLLGYNTEIVKKRMNDLHAVAMRLELKEGINNCSLINDSYSSDINSLEIALEFLDQQKQHNKKTVIISDILQSGKPEEELYNEVAQLLAKRGVDRIIGIGPEIARQSVKFKMEKTFYLSTMDFLNKFPFSNFYKETILLKGARIFEFEKISDALQEKTHTTILEINLDSLVHNLNYFRSKLKSGTKIMAMVKAFSYGSGSFEIANILQYHKIDYLAVAYADEGVQLRNAGINVPIMVMNPDKESLESIRKYNLEPEIYSLRVLDMLIDSIIVNGNSYNVHLKLDTGMHRLGFESKDIDPLVSKLMENKNIKVNSIFSHLTSSEDPTHDDFTTQQIMKFKEMSRKITQNLEIPVLLHILNSGGINRFPDAQFDMVRLGISLYGISSDNTEQEKLQQTGVLKSTISQIKHIGTNQTIGYNRQWTAKKPTVIGTVAIGYADGLNRKLGNGKGSVIINNIPAPIIGNICMDMCMVDITGINAKEGDEVIIFGKDNPISEMAETLDTIPYEVLTSIPQRVKRVYYRE